MCDFKNKFVLCSCLENGIEEGQIDWILRRRKPENKETKHEDSLKYTTFSLGQRILPSDLSNEEQDQLFLKKGELAKALLSLKEKNVANLEKIEATSSYITSALNQDNCFDKTIELLDKDMLCIRIDKTSNLWGNFIYRKSTWRIANFSMNKDKYTEIIQGFIKK